MERIGRRYRENAALATLLTRLGKPLTPDACPL
jgi:hypothetical protein